MDKEQVDSIVENIHQIQQQQIIDTLKAKDIWFTTKQDPTYMEPSSYYELDEYGCPTEKSLQQIEKDCEDFVGEGAIDFNEAIDMWIEKCLAEGKIAYKDYLVTKFKDKPVVDEIQAYNVKTENKKIVESFTKEQAQEYTNKITSIVISNLKNIPGINYGAKPTSAKLLNSRKVIQIKYSITSKQRTVEITNNLLDICDTIKEQIETQDFRLDGVSVTIETNEQDTVYLTIELTRFKEDVEVADYTVENKSLNESEFANEDLLNDFTQYVANNAKEINNGVYEVDVPQSLGYDKILNKDMLKKAYMKVKQLLHLDNGDTQIVFENKELKTENYKTRLKEENTKSLNLISQMFQDEDFDANSNEGKIVVKTSTLFNTLSDKGYDVQVAFDNGDSQSTILLGQQGGSVNITITDATKPLQAFTSGSIELNKDNLKVLQDIVETIQDVK